MADLLGSLLVRLAADAAQFESDLGRAARIADKRMGDIERRARQVGVAVGAALGAAVTALAAGTGAAIKRIDDLGDRAARLGVGVEPLQELGFAASQSGTDVETLEVGLRNLSKQMAEAAGGGKAAQSVFAAIGVNVKDSAGNLRAADEVFKDIATRFSEYEDGAGKVALANQLFGKSGTQLIATLNEGAAGLDAFAEKARRLGLVVSDDTVKAAQEFSDQLDVLQGLGTAFFNSVAGQLLPALVNLANVLVEDGEKAAAAGQDFNGFATILEGVLQIAVAVNAAFQVLGRTVGGVVALIAQNASALKSVVTGGPGGSVANNVAIEVAKNFESSKRIVSELQGDVIAEVEKAIRRIGAINQPLKAAGAAAESAAGKLGKTKAPIVQTGEAAEGAAKAVAELEREMAELEKLRVAELMGAETDELDRLQKTIDETTEAAARLNAVIEEFSNVNQEAAQLTKLEVALEDAIAAGDPAKIRQIEEAIVRVGTAAVVTAEQTAQIRIGDEVIGDTLDLVDSLGSALLDGSDGWRNFALTGTQSMTKLLGGISKLEGGLTDFTKLFFDGGKPTEALSALGNIFGQLAAASGGGTKGALMGAASGFITGLQTGNIYIAVASAIVGAFAGYGGGDKNPVLTVGTSTTGRNGTRPEASLSTPLGQVTVGTQNLKDPTSRQVAEAFQDFDRTLVDILDTAQENAARAALRTFEFRGEGGEATIGQALEQRLETVAAATLGAQAGAFIREFSNDFQTQLAAFGDIVQLDRLDDQGRLIVNSLTDALDLITKFGRAGEGVGATYARIAAGVELVERAFAVAGVTFEGSRIAFVELSTTIVDEIGTIEQATRLFKDAFDFLYSESELLAAQIQNATRDAERELADVGLGATAGRTEVRAGLEEAIAAGNEALIREYLEAAQALGILTDLQTEYAESLGETTTNLDDLVQAQQDYAEFIADIDRQLGDVSASDFQRELRDVSSAFRENVRRANELARAAGLQGAREQDLARIHNLAAAQASEAIRLLEESSRDLVGQLYGQVDTGTLTQSVTTVAAGIDRLREAANAFRDATLLDDDLSPLNVQKRYEEALRQLRQTGDEATGRTALALARRLMASGSDYNAAFDLITGLVRPGGGREPAIDPTGATRTVTEIDKESRRALADDLAQNVADLAGAQGITFAEVATNLGFSLDQLATDLGLNAEALDSYLVSLQADSYSFEDLSNLISDEVDRIVEAIREGEVVDKGERFSDARNAKVAEVETVRVQDSVDAMREEVGDLLVQVGTVLTQIQQASAGNLTATEGVQRAIGEMNDTLFRFVK